IKWSEDQSFSERETVIIREHFFDLLLRYKEIIEGYSNVKRQWENDEQNFNESTETKLNDMKTKEKYLEEKLERQLSNAANWIDAFPFYITHNENKKSSNN